MGGVMAEIVVLPWVERPDLYDMPAPDAVLTTAMDAGLTNCIVIGRDRTGEFYVASSDGDLDKVAGMLARAMRLVTQASESHSYEIEVS